MPFHLITHNDLDAVAIKVLLEVGELNVIFTRYCTYDNIDDTVVKFIRAGRYESGDTLLIADICPGMSTCDVVDREKPEKLNVVLLDHHKTRDWANKYAWAKVDTSKCGTEMVYDKYLNANNDASDSISQFVEAVAAWDLWKKSSPRRPRGENLNNLLGFIGKEEFSDMFAKDINSDSAETMKSILHYLNLRKERYVKQVIKEQIDKAPIRKDGLGNLFKIIFATDFHGEIGEAALAHPDYEELHYICIVNPSADSCSLRSRIGETDVSFVAKCVDGGGHQAAAGFPMELTEVVEELIFKKLNEIDLR